MVRREFFALLALIALKRASPTMGIYRPVTRSFVGPTGWAGYELGSLRVGSQRCREVGCRDDFPLEDGRCWKHSCVAARLEAEYMRRA